MITRKNIEEDSTFVAATPEQLPVRVKEILEQGVGGSKKRDYLTALQKGPEWLFEYTRKYQPLTGSVLSNGKLMLYGRPAEKWDKTNPDDDYFLNFGLEVNGFFVSLYRKPLGKNPDDEGYLDFIERGNRKLTKTWGKPTVMEERHLSLPFELRQAYYSRFDGLNIPESPAQGIYTRLLPFPVGRPWQPIDMYLGQLRLKKKLALIHEWFPDCQPKRKSDPYIKLMIFLDTRPTLSGKEGDVFFVKNHIQDGIIYYIRDGDIDNLMVLNEPVEAIDRYCHHILTRSEGRFDFMPYARKFEG